MLALIDTVLANSRSAGTERLVLLILARSANQRGYSRPPVRVIAHLCGRSDQTVREALAHLATLGEIARVEQGGGKGKATTWQILVRRDHDLPNLNIPPHDHDWAPDSPLWKRGMARSGKPL